MHFKESDFVKLMKRFGKEKAIYLRSFVENTLEKSQRVAVVVVVEILLNPSHFFFLLTSTTGCGINKVVGV